MDDKQVTYGNLMEKLNRLDKLDNLPDWSKFEYTDLRAKIYLLENKINNLEATIKRNAPAILNRY